MGGAYLQILQGDTYSFSTVVSLDGVSQNITGATLWFLAKGDPDNDLDSEAVINCSTASGQISVNVNTITISMNSDTTANYAQANVLHWALKMQLGVTVTTLDRGRACVVTPIITTN